MSLFIHTVFVVDVDGRGEANGDLRLPLMTEGAGAGTARSTALVHRHRRCTTLEMTMRREKRVVDASHCSNGAL